MIFIYTTRTCGFCTAAKSLLTEQGFEYQEILLDNPESIKQFKIDCPGKTTVPQILWHGFLIEGGYEGLRKTDLSLLASYSTTSDSTC